MSHIYFPLIDTRDVKVGSVFTITHTECPHLFSFRPRTGDTFTLTSFHGVSYEIEINEYSKQTKQVVACVTNITHLEDSWPYYYDVAYALTDKVYIEKFIEFSAFFPIHTIFLYVGDYSNTRHISSTSFDRLHAILIRSSEQCQRTSLPSLIIHDSYDTILALSYEKKYLFHTHPVTTPAQDKHTNTTAQSIVTSRPLYIFGAEGGFSPREITAAQNAQVQFKHTNGIIYPAWASLLLIHHSDSSPVLQSNGILP